MDKDKRILELETKLSEAIKLVSRECRKCFHKRECMKDNDITCDIKKFIYSLSEANTPTTNDKGGK